jgi:hypothetical protein
MQLQYLEDEKQELQDRLVSHEELLMGIIQELESELQAKDKMLEQLNKSEEVEKEKDTMQKKVVFTKGLQAVTEVCHEKCSVVLFFFPSR